MPPSDSAILPFAPWRFAPVKAPARVAEQLALDQRFGDGRAVHRHERTRGPVAGEVDGLGEDLLAGTGFAEEDDRDVPVHHALGNADGGGHPRVALRKGIQCEVRRRFLAESRAGWPQAARRLGDGEIILSRYDRPDAERSRPLVRAEHVRIGSGLENLGQRAANESVCTPPAASAVDPDDPPVGVERQQVDPIGIGKPVPIEQPDDPGFPEMLQEQGVLDALRRSRYQMLGESLTLPSLGCQCRDVEHGGKFARRIEDRADGAGQADMARLEMIVAEDRQRAFDDDAGADPVGALMLLRPDGAQIEPCPLEVTFQRLFADIVNRDTIPVGQQHDMIRRVDLGVKPLDFGLRDADQGFDRLTEVAQFRLGQNAGFGAPGGVQPIGLRTAFPTFGNHVMHGIVGIHLDISGHTG